MKGSFAAGVFFACLLSWPPAVSAQQEVQTKVLDLVFTVKDVAGKVSDLQVKESDTEIRIEMSADVLFDFDRADIKKEARPSLEKVADIVREHSRAAVAVEGHTDGKGSAAYNQTLSERRASSVARWLKGRKGLNRVRFDVRGFGASKPVAPNAKPDGSDDPDGRQKNRRVEIAVGKK
jgi:outer membrane protein OmpA-like peptidoglycan-associated protein